MRYTNYRNNPEIMKDLEYRLYSFEYEYCRIHDHAFRYHAQLTLENLSRENETVSYFKNRKALEQIVRIVVSKHRDEIIDYLMGWKTDLDIIHTFDIPVGIVYTSDDKKVRTNTVKVVITKDKYTGKLITKNAYPILQEV